MRSLLSIAIACLIWLAKSPRPCEDLQLPVDRGAFSIIFKPAMGATFDSATRFTIGHASACKMIHAVANTITGFAPSATVTAAPCAV
jgi:hypothetical protein